MNNTPTGLIAAKRLAVAVAAVCATLSAPAFADDDVKVLLDLMLKKGVITQQDYDQFMKDNADKAENKEFKTKRLDDDVTKSVKFMQKRDKDGAVSESGFGLTSANGDHTVNLTGRVHFDSRFISSDLASIPDRDTASVGDNFELRRARIGLNGKIFKDINYEIVANAVGSTTNIVDTAWMNYGFNKNAQVRVGRFKQPFSLEELTSSNNMDFMERSYINQLIPGKQLGAMMHGEPQKGFTYAASLYQNGFNPVSGESQAGGMAAARLTANLAELNNMADMVVHFGFAATGGKYQTMPTTSGNTQKIGDNYTRATIMAFRSENRGLQNVYRSQIGGDRIGNAGGVGGDYNASANNAANVRQMMSGLEVALASGSIKFQSEYARTNRDATHANVDYSSEAGVASTSASVDAKANTLYTEVMYNVTGESWADAYKGGAFSGIKPKSNFVYGTGGGAWQVGLRYSSYDASNTVIGTGGFAKSRSQNSSKANTVTLAANWILNPNARVMFNVSQTKFDAGVEALDTAQDSSTTKDETVISVRTQINF
jgi:phosphate-selective porin OprO/OprP